jgi:hypothetical protein
MHLSIRPITITTKKVKCKSTFTPTARPHCIGRSQIASTRFDALRREEAFGIKISVAYTIWSLPDVFLATFLNGEFDEIDRLRLRQTGSASEC